MTDAKIIIIGARGGSKRVVNKNLRLLGNRPLLAYTLQTADNLGFTTYLSSDSQEILNAGEVFKPNINLIKRPKELASDISTDSDWIKHLLDEYYKKNKSYPKQMIFLRPTTPFRCMHTLIDAMNKFDTSRGYDSLRSVEEMKESIYKTYLIHNNYLSPINRELSNVPNQSLSPSYTANGYIDILLTKQILESDDLYGESIMPFITEPTTEIDTEADLKYAHYLMETHSGVY